MQPNQSDPNSQNMTTSSGANIPEYLHMDPIVDPSIGAKKAKRRFVVVLLVLSLLIALAATLYWLFVLNSPEQRFYKALENALQTSYVTRQYEIISKNGLGTETTNMKVDSDVSQPLAPKTNVIDYSYAKTSQDGSTQRIKGKTTIVGDQQALAISEEATKTNTPLNVWNLKTLNNITDLSNGLAQVESMPVLNSSQGLIVTGNFSGDQRANLIAEIKSQAVYTIVSTKKEAENGGSRTVYTVHFDSDKLNQLNKTVARMIGSSQLLTYQQPKWADQETLLLSVDDKTNMFTEIEYTAGTEKRPNSFTKVITITYPKSLTITMPENGSSAK